MPRKLSLAENRHQLLARIASAVVILVGCLVLLGWSINFTPLKTLISGTVSMKANTALCFILAGVSLGWQTRKRQSYRVAKGCAIAVIAIALFTFSQDLFGWNLGIDQLLFKESPGYPALIHPGRMGDNTALNFALVGLALYLLPQRRRRSDYLAQTATVCAAAIAWLAVIGHAYNVQIFYRFIVPSTSMALHTSLTFLVLCAGILSIQANRGLMQTLTNDLAGGLVARQLILMAIMLPSILGWLILQGLRANFYDAAFSLGLLVVSLIVTLVLVIWKNAQWLNKLDYDRNRSDERLRSNEERLRLALTAANQGIYDLNVQTGETLVSPEYAQMLGYDPESFQETNAKWLERLHPDDWEFVSQIYEEYLEGDRSEYRVEFRQRTQSGDWKWISSLGKIVAWDAEGKPLRMLGTHTDISDRKKVQLNEQFINELDLRLRQLSDPEAMTWETVSSLGEYLNVDRCFWHELDWENRLAIVAPNWRREDVADLAGTYPLANFFTSEQFDCLAAGQTMIVPDVMTHPNTAPYAQNYHPLSIAAFVAVPCIQSGRWVAVLSISETTARNWRGDEVALLQETVSRLWPIIEHTRAAQALHESEYQYRTLFETIDQGFCVCQMLFDEKGEPSDYRFLEVNSVFEQMTGLEQATGKRVRELVPNLEDHWFQIYGKVVLTGEPVQYENQSKAMNRWFDVSAFRFGEAQNHKFAVLFTNITARKEAEQERERLLAKEQAAREEAERLNRLKDEFLAALSHELRTPLNPILGWTKLLQAQKLTAAKTTEALITIERNVKQQIALVDDLLDVSGMVQGKFNLAVVQPVDLAVILNAAIDTVHFAAIAKSLTLEFHLPSYSVSIMGDQNRLQQVFWNILSNAIKFTPDNGRVDVWLEQVENDAQVRITDTGIGISAEFLPHVFDRFRQADGSSTRRYGGLGLGCALIKHLVELHGGTVEIESLGEQQGATFTVKIPLFKEPTELSELRPQNSPKELPLPSLTGIRVLVIDDEPDNLDLLNFVLTQEGAIITAVTTAAEALKIASENPPDILISDIGMPEMDGYELLRQIRALPEKQNQLIPAIALTAFAQHEDEERALQAGFQAYLSKPFNLVELIWAIANQVR